MLPEIHEALARMLYERGRIPASEVDVTFETPTRDWIERRTRPTVDLFLFQVEENADLRQNTFSNTRGNGQAERRLAPRRIDLHYLVSALATDAGDEHRLLWRVLATLMRYRELPAEILSPGLQSVEPAISARLAQDEQVNVLDLWSSLNATPRPALHYIITAPLDLDISVQAPLVLTRTAQYRRMQGEVPVLEVGTHIGGIVRATGGTPLPGVAVRIDGSTGPGAVTDANGWFRLPDVPTGTVTLRLTRIDGSETTAQVTVPSDTYELTLE